MTNDFFPFVNLNFFSISTDLPLMECLRECSTNEDALRFVLISACSKNLSTVLFLFS